LVVEDERIVARDIQAALRQLGYEVPATAASGDDALRLVEEIRPHLIMMDINIQGDKDGVQTAMLVRERFDVPVVFLTANSDDATLHRAKQAQPYGFLLKPFEERELRAVIETALYKPRVEARLRESEARLHAILRSIGDGVIAADRQGKVVFLNPVAEALTGWTQSEALGVALNEVFFSFSATQGAAENTLARLMREETSGGLLSHAWLMSRAGGRTPIEHTISSITGRAGGCRGGFSQRNRTQGFRGAPHTPGLPRSTHAPAESRPDAQPAAARPGQSAAQPLADQRAVSVHGQL